MTAGSAAHALLAFTPAEEVTRLLPNASFTARTLLDVRRRGWAHSVAEREPGVASLSAPVRDGAGAVLGAVSISGPVERLGRRPEPGDRRRRPRRRRRDLPRRPVGPFRRRALGRTHAA